MTQQRFKLLFEIASSLAINTNKVILSTDSLLYYYQKVNTAFFFKMKRGKLVQLNCKHSTYKH